MFSLAEIEDEEAQMRFDDVEEEFHKSLSHSPLRRTPGTPSEWGLGEKWGGMVTSSFSPHPGHPRLNNHMRDGGRADAIDFSGLFPGPAIPIRVSPVPPTPALFRGGSPITASTVANALLVEELVCQGKDLEAQSVLERMRFRDSRDGETNTTTAGGPGHGVGAEEEGFTFLDFWAEIGVVERMLNQMGAPPSLEPEPRLPTAAKTSTVVPIPTEPLLSAIPAAPANLVQRHAVQAQSSPDRSNRTISASTTTPLPHESKPSPSPSPSPSRAAAFDELYQLSLSIEHSLHSLANSIIKDKRKANPT